MGNEGVEPPNYMDFSWAAPLLHKLFIQQLRLGITLGLPKEKKRIAEE